MRALATTSTRRTWRGSWGFCGTGSAALRSGMDYSLGRGAFVKRVENWKGIECYDFHNSLNVSPASSNFRNMEREISSPRDN